jgi:hypothetical protein
MPKGVCAMPYNLTDYRPLMRGALVALDRWVKDATPAPASRYPRIADGTPVPSVKLNAAILGLATAKGPNEKPRLDFGPDIDKGIIGKALPVALTTACWCRASTPTATKPPAGYHGAHRHRDGLVGAQRIRRRYRRTVLSRWAFIPFAETKAEREATKDPRPSLAERYRDNADYSERVKAAATALEHDLLPKDAKRIVERAAKLIW